MDTTESMTSSGSTVYYMQRGTVLSGSGLQGSSSILQPSTSSGNISFHSNAGAGSVVGAPSAVPQFEPMRRKRGRPRKYGSNNRVSLALSPSSSSPANSGPIHKRGRGRPPGTGRKQQLTAVGGWMSSSAGMGFTAHVITIAVGEDIATKIMSFSQQGHRALCILSANGAVSTVTLRQPSTSGGTVTYEGRFEILCLSGSYWVSDIDGPFGGSGALNVSLASPDGRVIGGGVGGVLIAASPCQIVVGSFLCAGSKTKNRAGEGLETQRALAQQNFQHSLTPANAERGQNLTTTSSMGVWPSSVQMGVHTRSGIDLMRG